jgi:hypothetical protein
MWVYPNRRIVDLKVDYDIAISAIADALENQETAA